MEKKEEQRPAHKYSRQTKHGGNMVHDGNSKFDKVVGKHGDMEEGDRVCLASDKNCNGTVKWIGRYHHVDPESEVDEELIVGVKLDAVNPSLRLYLTFGDLDGEHLVPTTKRDVMFKYFSEWMHVGAQTAHGVVHQSPDSKFDRVDVDINGFHVGSRVKLTDGSVGTVRWIGCYHNTDVECGDYIVGVELDSVEKLHPRLLTDGEYEGERLVESKERNIKFTNLGKLHKHAEKKSSGRKAGGSSQAYSPPAARAHQVDRHQHASDVELLSEELPPEVHKDKTVQARHSGKSLQASDAPVLTHRFSRQNPPSVDLRMDLGPISASRPSSKEVGNVFIENDPHRLLPDAKQKVASEMQKVKPTDISLKGNVRANTTTRETVRYATPQPTTAPVSVGSKSTNDYLPMDTEHFAEHDYSWTRDQFDAGFLLRGTATQQDDKTYYTVIVALKPYEKDLADESGEPLEDVVNEVVLPPTHPEQYNDFWKGVQGGRNSCYMDASMFAMFSYLTVFDDILYGKGATTSDVRRTENIRQVLRTQIVNPLRKYGLAQKKGMHVLRKLLDEWGLVKGLTGDGMDPEEFLNLLLVTTFATPPPIVLSNGQESHLFHLLAEKEEGMDFPTVQELVERTCLQDNLKFSKIPPYLILLLPRFGKDFKMYEKIMPSLELDVTDVISGTSQSCYICEAVATHECYGCYKDCYNISGSCFCSDCVEDYHRAPTRREHKPQKLIVADKDDGLATAKCVLKLAAVLCIETSYYVTFVASDTTATARWYFFNSMADREGTTNIPQVREVPEFRKHLSEAKKSVDGVPPLIRRLVKDGYICFYTNPDVPQYYALGTSLNVTMPGGCTSL